MKRPAFQFYPADWQKDAELQSCSIAARGLWIEMMCICHQCEPYGHLAVNGSPLTAGKLARLVGETPALIKRLLAELRGAGVYSEAADGCVYSRRMVEDERIRNIRADAGRLGGNPALVRNKVNQIPNDVDNQDSNQDLTPSSSSSSSSSETLLPANAGSVAVTRRPDCPHEQIIELYQKHCPELPGIATWTPTRRAYLQARWKEDKRRQNLDWWERFFKYIHKSDWLCGRIKSRDGGKPFMADLEWIITLGNFVKILERKYENKQDGPRKVAL